MKKLFTLLKFEKKLIVIQFTLIIPFLIVVLITYFNWLHSYTRNTLIKNHHYTLSYMGNSVDNIFQTCIKLLEKPYSNKALYNILNRDYNTLSSLEQYTIDKADHSEVSSILYNDILYYYDYIASVTIVPTNKNNSYFKYSTPSLPNVSNDWTTLHSYDWYTNAVATDSPIISSAYMDTLFFHNNSPIISFSQRLKNVLENKILGVMRIDVRIDDLAKDWNNLIINNSDILLVFDHTSQLIYSSQPELSDILPLSQNDIVNTMPQTQNPKYISTQYTAPISGFNFIYLSSMNQFNTQFTILYLSSMTFIILGFFIAIVFIFFSSRQISRPIHLLKMAMQQGQKKDLSVRCQPLSGEMGELSDAFNTLMETMNQLVLDVTATEAEKNKLFYEVLQSKINPHFLYNTLNAIKWKADVVGAKSISKTLDSLVLLLKFTIKCKDEMIPLSLELEQLEYYIEIMRLRYGDDIDINFDIDEECFSYQSIKFLIQPILENCFLHAFNQMHDSKYINISIYLDADMLVYEIYDNGSGIPSELIEQLLTTPPDNPSNLFISIGLHNVNQRIHVRFGNDYGISITSELNHYTKVTAKIPKLPIEGAIHENITC